MIDFSFNEEIVRAKKKEMQESGSGTDQNKYNCNVAKSAEKGVFFSLLSTSSCIKYMYTLCMTRSEPWALALRASAVSKLGQRHSHPQPRQGRKLVFST